MSDEIRVSKGNYKYASFWIRLLALIIDKAIIFLVVFLFSGLNIDAFSGDISQLIAQTWHYNLVFFVYLLLMWIWLSKSLGMLILKIRIVDAGSGAKMKPLQAIIRLLGYVLSVAVALIGFIWMAFHPKKQGWMDLIAKTYVVYKR